MPLTQFCRGVLAALLVSAFRAQALEPAEQAGPAVLPPVESDRAAVSSTHGAAWKAHVDPKSGELTAKPPAGSSEEPPASGRAAVGGSVGSDPASGLRRGTTAGGGMILDVQGRFDNELRMNLKPGGESRTECGPGAPSAKER